MPANRKVPSYRQHKAPGQAVVTLGGRDFYLGLYGTEISRREYDRLIAEWLANGRVVPVDAALSINEVVLAYWEHAQVYYRKNGQPTDEAAAVRNALRPLVKLYGEEPAAEFGPSKLKAIREKFIAADLARKTVNDNVGRIKRMFKWAVAEELVPRPSTGPWRRSTGSGAVGRRRARRNPCGPSLASMSRPCFPTYPGRSRRWSGCSCAPACAPEKFCG
jgi:hypothetical protein